MVTFQVDVRSDENPYGETATLRALPFTADGIRLLCAFNR